MAGAARQAWRGMARRGLARRGRRGRAGHGPAWRGRHGKAWLGWTGPGMARLGRARRGWAGWAWLGAAGQGVAGQAWPAGHGWARLGAAGPGTAWQDKQNEAAGRCERPAAPTTTNSLRRVTKTMTASVEIAPIASERLLVPIRGTAPLIVHAWSEKAKRQMLDAQQGRKTPKQIREPEADYEASIYRTTDGYGFPTLGFKAATVGAARFFGKSVRMTEIRQFVFFQGVPSATKDQILTAITGEPHMREDMVRVGMGTDLRYRGEFSDWTAVLDVTYVTTALARQSVLSLIDAGGMGVGIGEWRPEKDGLNGTYQIDTTRDIEAIK